MGASGRWRRCSAEQQWLRRRQQQQLGESAAAQQRSRAGITKVQQQEHHALAPSWDEFGQGSPPAIMEGSALQLLLDATVFWYA
jgi:hypothetical protein